MSPVDDPGGRLLTHEMEHALRGSSRAISGARSMLIAALAATPPDFPKAARALGMLGRGDESLQSTLADLSAQEEIA